ncbi:hypothetical protein D2T32_09430 [Sinirhodobacter populi]|nr:hypothetical protein D2T32_09430 [Sinirhodobacter populi]
MLADAEAWHDPNDLSTQIARNEGGSLQSPIPIRSSGEFRKGATFPDELRRAIAGMAKLGHNCAIPTIRAAA